jgi:hypothetical protein
MPLGTRTTGEGGALQQRQFQAWLSRALFKKEDPLNVHSRQEAYCTISIPYRSDASPAAQRQYGGESAVDAADHVDERSRG